MEKEIKIIAEHWGKQAQLHQLQEECAELIVAVSHYNRGRENSEKELAEEIGDVEIILEEIKHLLKNENEINESKKFKIERELKRINGRETFDMSQWG